MNGGDQSYCSTGWCCGMARKSLSVHELWGRLEAVEGIEKNRMHFLWSWSLTHNARRHEQSGSGSDGSSLARCTIYHAAFFSTSFFHFFRVFRLIFVPSREAVLLMSCYGPTLDGYLCFSLRIWACATSASPPFFCEKLASIPGFSSGFICLFHTPLHIFKLFQPI